MNPYNLYAEIEPWIRKQRWFPSRVKRYSIVEAWRAGEDIYIGIIATDQTRIFVPLVVRNTPPLDIPGERVCKIDNSYVYEAELDPIYINYLLSNRVNGIRIEFIEDLSKEKAREVYIVSTDTSNTLVLAKTGGKEFILKSYRAISYLNSEPLYLKYLLRTRIAPHLYAVAKLDDTYVSTIMEYIDARGDGGKPFFESLLLSLKENRIIIPYKATRNISATLAIFHREMSICSEEWCGRKRITEKHVERWVKRLRAYYKAVEKFASKLQNKIDNEVRRVVNYVGENVVSAIQELNNYLGKIMIRTHQDLHMGQMLFTPESRFIIIDFEGEPGRPKDEKFTLEPAVRDLACLLRSLPYIGFFALKEHYGISMEETVESILSENNEVKLTREWIKRVRENIIHEYIASTAQYSLQIHGVPRDELSTWVSNAIYPWLIERALYEALYEMKYRHGWSIIPLLGVVFFL